MRSSRFLFVGFLGVWLAVAAACSASAPTPLLSDTPTPADRVSAPTVVISEPSPSPSPFPTVVPTLVPTNTPIPTPTSPPVFALGQPAVIENLGLAVIKTENVTDPIQKGLYSLDPGTDPFLAVTLFLRNSTTANQVFQLSQLHLHQVSSLETALTLCNPYKSSFSQILQPGDTLRFTACWTVPAGESALRLTYQGKDNQVIATWDVSSAGEAPVSTEFQTPALTAVMNLVGQSVVFHDVTVTLTKTETIHTANPSKIDITRVRFFFTYENKGGSDAALSNEFLSNFGFKSVKGDLFTRTVDPNCGAPGFGSEVMKPGEKRSERFCLTAIGKIETAGGRLYSYVATAKDQFDFVNWLIK